MSFADQMREVAVRLAKYAQSRAVALEHELLEVEARKREIEAQLDAAKFAHQRLKDFIPMRAGGFQCPGCWIERETISALRPTCGGTDKKDIFKCDTCNYEFPLRL
jgi:hypothetical protein